MSPLSVPITAVIALVGGPIWFVHGFANFRRKRLIENTPTARIRSMAMGLVEVNGRVYERSTLLGPFSGRPCVHWTVEIATQSGKRGWNTVHRSSSGQPFFIRDETGTALVYPQGSDFRVNYGVDEECLGTGLPEVYAQYLHEHCGPQSALWRISLMRFREKLLEDGQQVFVMGTAQPRARAFDISGGDELAATGTDGPAARTANPREALDHDVSAVIRQGSDERTFIVSQDSERTVTVMMGIHAFFGMLGGPAVTLYGLGYLLYALAHAGH